MTSRLFTLAQAALPELHPAEVLFFKILALGVMILWAVYLVKEIFMGGHKEDPRLAGLMAGMQQTTIQLAVLSTNIAHLAEANKDQKAREEKMWAQISGISKSLSTLANDHAQLEGASIAHAMPVRPGQPR